MHILKYVYAHSHSKYIYKHTRAVYGRTINTQGNGAASLFSKNSKWRTPDKQTRIIFSHLQNTLHLENVNILNTLHINDFRNSPIHTFNTIFKCSICTFGLFPHIFQRIATFILYVHSILKK